MVNTKKHFIYLLMLWLFVTAFNVFKPVHIDDTAYMESAKWIAENPLKPMSGMLNWHNTSLPIYQENFPPLFSYILAGVIKLFGVSIVSLHLVVSVFVVFSIFVFYKYLSSFKIENRLWLIVAFFASPFYLPAQNIMLDVPMLALWILFYFILITRPKSKLFYYSLSGLIILLACLFKYVSLALIPVFLIIIIICKDYRYLYATLIPIAGLISWSLFNYLEYGGIHLLSTGGGSFSLNPGFIRERIYAWIVILGGILPVLVPFYFRFIFSRSNFIKLVIPLVVIIYVVLHFNAFHLDRNIFTPLLTVLFFINGVILLCVFTNEFILKFLLDFFKSRQINSHAALMILWFIAPLLFVIIFSPFVAVRHVLLALPPIFIAAGVYMEKTNKPSLIKIGVTITVLLGVLVAISDFQYATIYKTQASEIKREYNEAPNIWFLGHWGWQWYANKEGFKQYDKEKSELSVNDIIVQPQIPIQLLSEEDKKRIELIGRIKAPLRYGLIIRTMVRAHRSGYYACNPRHCLPWYINFDCPDEFLIYRIAR